jgi:hypothetical protein
MNVSCNQLLKLAYTVVLVALVVVLTTPSESNAQAFFGSGFFLFRPINPAFQARPRLPSNPGPGVPTVPTSVTYTQAVPNPAQPIPSPFQNFLQTYNNQQLNGALPMMNNQGGNFQGGANFQAGGFQNGGGGFQGNFNGNFQGQNFQNNNQINFAGGINLAIGGLNAGGLNAGGFNKFGALCGLQAAGF